MAIFISGLARDAPLTKLGGNLGIPETIPAPERRIRGASGAWSYDTGRVRLLTFGTVPLNEAETAHTFFRWSPWDRSLFADQTRPLVLLPAEYTHGLLRNLTWDLTLGTDVKATRTLGKNTHDANRNFPGFAFEHNRHTGVGNLFTQNAQYSRERSSVEKHSAHHKAT